MKNLIPNYHLLGLICFTLLVSCQKNVETQPEIEIGIIVDSLFQKWDNESSPGVAVAVVKNGEIIFKKGYGMANLEYGIPIGPSTIFHIASESKQFTAFCITLLAQQGKLSLDDDIRKHLPYIPDFGEKISIKNLIYHTSGLRDQWQLLAISGTRLDDVITQDHILKLVENQKILNFEPGEQHIYSNTGYTLLAEIVKKVSGKSLRAFAELEIFQPLGMKNTHFHDNYTEIVKNRAYSYYQKDSISFENAILTYSTVGATSLFTTVEDEAKWLKNLNTGEIGGMEVVKQMHELGTLNSGDTLKYAFGLETYNYKGWKRISHGGGDAGFRSYVARFPEANLGIIVFSNTSNFNASVNAMKIIDALLPEKEVEKKNTVYDFSFMKNKIGKYYSDQGMFCELIDSTKFYLKFNWGLEPLIPASDSTFSFFDGAGKLKFNKNKHDSFEYYSYSEKQLLKKYTSIDLNSINRKEYVGVFQNEELDSKYKIHLNDDNLILQHNKYMDVTLHAVYTDQFSCPYWWMSHIIFDRNKKGDIIGFEINSGGVLHLYFKKSDT